MAIHGERKYKIFLNSFYPLLIVDFVFGIISIIKTGTAVVPFDGVVFLSIVGIIVTGNGVEHLTKKIGVKIQPGVDEEEK